MLFSENHSHSSMDLGDKLALGSPVINPENDSNGILARNVVCCVAATAPRRLPESFSFEEGAAWTCSIT